MSNYMDQFEEVCQIQDIDRRISYAVSSFLNMNYSAKVIRMLFNSLDNNKKIELLDQIYSKENRQEVIKRLPPRVFIPESAVTIENDDYELWSNVLKYVIITDYESSKTQQKFYKFKKVINNFLNGKELKISGYFLDSNKDEHIIKSKALHGFMEELMKSEKKQDILPLGLPSNMTIGTELEIIGCSEEELAKLWRIVRGYGITYLDGFEIKGDGSVYEKTKEKDYYKEGAEINSPVIQDSFEDWERLKNACQFLNVIGTRVNDTCGGHIHIGEDVLGVDKKAWQTLLEVWKEAEPIIFQISNRRGEKTRKRAFEFSQRTDKRIQRIDWETVSVKSYEDLMEIAQEVQYDEYNRTDRYTAINLSNILYGGIGTIEFRLSNGTIDYNILRENILLYGRLVQMAKLNSIDPNRKKDQLASFFEGDLTKREKLVRFLDLVFDDDEEKQIFFKRWESKNFDASNYHDKSDVIVDENRNKEGMDIEK